MVKIFLCFFIPFVYIASLFGNEGDLDYKIISLLGVQDYKVNQKFIQRLFENKADYLNEQGQADLYKISKTLKENGLLKLAFQSPMELEVAFEIKENPTAFTGFLYEVLGSIGYYYFLVKQSTLNNEKFQFILSMNTEYAIDPVLLQEKLHSYGYCVSKIEKRSLTQWVYEIKQETLKHPRAVLLELGESKREVSLKGEYWYEIESGSMITLSSVGSIFWYPRVVFFDKDFKILEASFKESAIQRVSVAIPKEAKFIKVSDNYLPITIKNGLNAILQ